MTIFVVLTMLCYIAFPKKFIPIYNGNSNTAVDVYIFF